MLLMMEEKIKKKKEQSLKNKEDEIFGLLRSWDELILMIDI